MVLWTIPTFALFVNSFRTRDAQRNSGFWNALADNANGQQFPTLDNYQEVLFPDVGAGLGNALLNSAAIAIVATIIPIAIAAFAAYAFAWIDFRGREWLFIATVALLAVPTQVSLIPLLSAYSNGVHMTIPIIERTITLIPDANLSGSIPAVWLTHTGFRSAVCDLPTTQLHRGPAEGHLRIGVHRRRRPFQDLLAPGGAVVGAGVGGVRHLPVPLDVERLSDRIDDDRWQP